VILPLHRLDVDFSERHAAVLDLARQAGGFDVRLVRLAAGDYLIDNAVLVERKTPRISPRPSPTGGSSRKPPPCLAAHTARSC